MDKWHQFVDGEVIIKQGFVNKRKGLFARKRMLLLTTGPKLIYVDPVQMVKKGEIPWSAELKTETKSFKIFFVHTVSTFFFYILIFCQFIFPFRHNSIKISAVAPCCLAISFNLISKLKSFPNRIYFAIFTSTSVM